MGWLKNVLRYLPMIWLGIKTLWSMYKAHLRQEGLRDALKSERDRRIKAQRDLDLRDRVDDPVDVRRERIRREAAEREKARSD